ncbi:Prolyl tripeptidyl peptidase precursor [Sedimentisphaera cyanobacteriorum]|uniref:Prolyl tripeptidyl peptidase n=1 Tax=Sedimentisphaera cyanobacteriorum TaxID=1940790 RepID=A0A1Q2HNJ2_9BACT|nr:prolyl oligopeptidase family serine peptidase [Sedimentisphaera cyanobacteriorum]AQQ09079.1 Prolyl tripeptidyl peptidase precursor [Sedimentisphaera cyanobacteriorum]
MRQSISLITLIAAASIAASALDLYKKADESITNRGRGLVFTDSVNPNWIHGSSSFWYKRNVPEGSEYLLVCPDKKLRKRAFSHKDLAEKLSRALGKKYSPLKLPFNKVLFSKDLRQVSLEAEGKKFTYTLEDSNLKQVDSENNKPKNKAENKNAKPRKQLGKVSPNGKWRAFRKNHNLWFENMETGKEFAATQDGKLLNAYASSVPAPQKISDEDFLRGGESIKTNFTGAWSPDSKYFACHKVNLEGCGLLHLLKNAPKNSARPELYSYVYPMGADENVPECSPYVFCPSNKTGEKCDVKPIYRLYYGGAAGISWDRDSQTFTYLWRARGYKQAKLIEINAETAKPRTIISEKTDTTLPPMYREIYKLKTKPEILWTSEQKGWNQLYNVNRDTGEAKLLTPAPFFTKKIYFVNEKQRFAVIAGAASEEGDPYYRYIYKVNLDGKGIKLLTPGLGNHKVKFGPRHKYFIDSVSTVECPPEICLRNMEGEKVLELEKADISQLLETGWEPPVKFKTKAADGETDIYGNLFLPKNKKPQKAYPVLEHVYTGPHSYYTRKHFRPWCWEEVYTKLGFAVIRVDPRGTGCRSKKFHDYSYKNLGESGIDDRIAAIKQMAKKYPCIDASRVGCFGGSAGGYDAARALLIRPEFYSAAVAVSGNHDHRNDKAWWAEAWMSYPDEGQYKAQSNITAAKNLEGNLLLIHGDMDKNVHISASFQLAEALIKANKNFDFIPAVNSGHGCPELYYERRRWDYFIKHLKGLQPPEEYNIGKK